jgi:hypothetical protein
VAGERAFPLMLLKMLQDRCSDTAGSVRLRALVSIRSLIAR